MVPVILAAESARDTLIQLDSQFLVQLGFMLFNAVAAVGIVAKLLYKPVSAFLAERAERVAGEIDSAEKAKADASALKTELEERLRHVESEREAILSEARRIAHDREARIMADARREAQLITERAAMEIERDRLRSSSEIRRQIISVASLLAGRYISASMDAEASDRLVRGAINDLGEAEWIS
ncbi:MAG: F0F1 ATP synthase subunit B [Clostridiales bacterium]|jgi:F-type H+-transporting ATPase subunit b|nr:F0F1 ATP synthase subunit B [Clostridiales bacterium]